MARRPRVHLARVPACRTQPRHRYPIMVARLRRLEGQTMKVFEPGESTGGIYPMPELPHLERAIITAITQDDRFDLHACVWPHDVAPPRTEYVHHCNCGAIVQFARAIAASIRQKTEG